jgi:hypothetical protein
MSGASAKFQISKKIWTRDRHDRGIPDFSCARVFREVRNPSCRANIGSGDYDLATLLSNTDRRRRLDPYSGLTTGLRIADTKRKMLA